ncbi:hypothetical protein M422DRAFT_61249 [Sphaerobolus stellatus SS14]|uniref:Unplaced genomic scaffold SPHSTscaffold_110, whole genome shotgun sequence n=1 Tax=Sphaerobolus stellatus (strain SS14) TaxID=990650 RepID=A0A0C9VDS3_SPHS4|nr:hypothetical protein M422DRAFT_61249 [Sphaerobolus stellatus SS14]
MSLPARNLSAIVTGSARGIGRAIALRLAKDGYNVALNDLPTRKSIIVPGGVTDEKAVDEMVSTTVKQLGDLYMVANADILSPGMPLNIWNRFISVNLTGVFLCYRAAARQMLKQNKGGRIIASELGKTRITVNAYAPGFIDTPMHEMGTPENIASLVSYIASYDADFMTGQSVSINGGLFYD